MALRSGISLGPYEVGHSLGSGGMAEVYQARDTRLGRDVAIKVLPDALAGDRERLERFQREAYLLASLNHPNIASIYGLEESGDAHFLVLELVPGRTLAEVLLHDGPLPLDEALPIWGQIAEALGAAHEKGIIHRDVKPGNVMITPEGSVKVLDFGLAKDIAPLIAAGDPSGSPTIDSTRLGVILGTIAYMSPQQARGRPVDRRADIWAFGCVMYECLAGRKAFGGKTNSDILASVLKSEPDWEALPAATPTRIRELLRRCLQKDPKYRLHDIADARIEIEEARARLSTPEPEVAGIPRGRRWVRAIPWGLAALSIAFGIWSLTRTRHSGAPVRAQLVMPLRESEALRFFQGSSIALSPDGSRLVYMGRQDRYYLRSLDSLDSETIQGVEGGHGPFFSPDGRWIGYFADGYLKKAPVIGGASTSLCSVATAQGGSWGFYRGEETIVFASSPYSGLSRISPGGTTPQALTTPGVGERSHRWPQILPGGNAVLFTVYRNPGFTNAAVAVQSLKSGEKQILIEGAGFARYVADASADVQTGYLVYAASVGELMAAPFDLRRLRLTGPPFSFLRGAMINSTNLAAQLTVSDTGSLAYLAGSEWGKEDERLVVGVNRKGEARPLVPLRREYNNPRFSPDGRRLAFTISQVASRDLWVRDLERDTMTRRTFSGNAMLPVWTPAGNRLTYCSDKDGRVHNLYSIPADGSGPEERLTTSENGQYPSSWSPDGRTLAFSQVHPATKGDIWVLSLDGDRKARPLIQTPFDESAAMFSPDGRWISYQSDESGQNEVYVQSFPGPGGKWQVSTEGGSLAVWARDMTELFYRQGDKVMAVKVKLKPSFSATKPRVVFEGRYGGGSFPDIAPDGRSFAMVQLGEVEKAPTQIQVVLGAMEVLRLGATGRK